jgi:hypothetical protein
MLNEVAIYEPDARNRTFAELSTRLRLVSGGSILVAIAKRMQRDLCLSDLLRPISGNVTTKPRMGA